MKKMIKPIMKHSKHTNSKGRKMRSLGLIGAVFLSVLALSACESAQEQLGLNKKAPDEFQVLRRAPLEMPPNYALRPPAPGSDRPQEQEMATQAAQAVFGGDAAPAQVSANSGEAFLLQQAGATSVDPNIRSKVDSESADFEDENEPVIDKLLGIGDDTPKASVVDPKKEAERLRQNAEAGKPVTEGETPSKIK
jgi:hypothetical protein